MESNETSQNGTDKNESSELKLPEDNSTDENDTASDSTTTEANTIAVKVICLGDSAVGKSKLLERFLKDDFKTHQNSTYALTLYKYKTIVNNEEVTVDLWDTAGQERFLSLHPSYYHQADACIMVFDATRKVTYKNLNRWYSELRQYRPEIPCFLAANKIDSNMDVTKRTFAFSERNEIPLYYVSAATGSNVVKLFMDAIEAAIAYKKNPTHWTDQILLELEKSADSSTEAKPSKVDQSSESKSNGVAVATHRD